MDDDLNNKVDKYTYTNDIVDDDDDDNCNDDNDDDDDYNDVYNDLHYNDDVFLRSLRRLPRYID